MRFNVQIIQNSLWYLYIKNEARAVQRVWWSWRCKLFRIVCNIYTSQMKRALYPVCDKLEHANIWLVPGVREVDISTIAQIFCSVWPHMWWAWACKLFRIVCDIYIYITNEACVVPRLWWAWRCKLLRIVCDIYTPQTNHALYLVCDKLERANFWLLPGGWGR